VLQSPFLHCIVGIVGIVGICIGNFKASISGVYRNLVELIDLFFEEFFYFFFQYENVISTNREEFL
jgi:hypothetical protein